MSIFRDYRVEVVLFRTNSVAIPTIEMLREIDDSSHQAIKTVPGVEKYVRKQGLGEKATERLLHILGVTVRLFQLAQHGIRPIKPKMIGFFRQKWTDSDGRFTAIEFVKTLEPNLWNFFCDFAHEAHTQGDWSDKELIICSAVYGSTLGALMSAAYTSEELKQMKMLFHKNARKKEEHQPEPKLVQMTLFHLIEE